MATPAQRRTAEIIAAHNVSPIQVRANATSPSTFHERIASSLAMDEATGRIDGQTIR
jgi:hypothetical protein